MNIREIASDFTAFIFSQDADIGSGIKFSLSTLKYDTYFFSDLDEMYVRLADSPPHFIILDHSSLVSGLSEVFQKILSYSSEIRLICLADKDVLNQFSSYREFNLIQYFDRQSDSVSEQVGFAIDLCAEMLFRLYQNEQVYNVLQGTQEELNNLKVDIEEQEKGPKARPFQLRIADYKSAESKEELVQKFFHQTPEQSWVFLKYVKSIQTYISISSQNMPEAWVEGLSYKVPTSQPQFNENLLIGEFSPSFLTYLKKKWEVDAVKILPLIFKNEIEGLFITTQDISAEVAEDFSLMSLLYGQILLEAQPKSVEMEDALTGFYNGPFYRRILDKEIDRSKRTFAPISLVKISVDTFREIEVSHGRNFCEEIIKKVAEVIKSTSRLPDYSCRTEENEFTLVLTNCNRKGAALRADRLRQQLKAETFSKTGVVVTISQGISEYPSLTTTAESLDESAKRSLDFIAAKGGDKICIYRAPQNHRPDFQVNS